MAVETVILLHSSGASPRQWSALAGRIPARFGLRAAVPALVGHGEEPPWRPAEAPSLQGEVDRICARLPADTGGVHLVGHSYGGAVAIKAALSKRLRVRSLTVYEPSLFSVLDHRVYRSADSPFAAGWAISQLFREGRTGEAARLYVDYWCGADAFARMPFDRRARMVERMPAVVDCFTALFADPVRAGDLGHLEVPTLLMTGTQSPRPSQDICEIVAGSLPKARLHWFGGLDHMGPVLEPLRVDAVIEEFLRLQHPDLLFQKIEVAA